MTTRHLIWIGAVIGSTAGGFLPSLWHSPMLSISGVLLSAIGGLVGIWAGWKVGQR